MLVLCVGMYRACSTWQYGVAGELLARRRDGQLLGFVDGGQLASEVGPGLDPRRWAVLKAHDAHRQFADRLDCCQALGIYSHRDLRDVAFSWMHKTGQTFDEVIREGFLSQCLRNDWFWRDRPGMLFQSYEALIAEPARGVAEIARHLGIELESGEDRAIADLYSFEANRKRTKDLSERLRAEGVELDSKDQGRYDSRTLLHWNHIRDGRAGYWDELASPGQKATLARICGPWLVEHGYVVEPPPDDRDGGPPGPGSPRLEDLLFEGLFRGQNGTYLDVGAAHPRVDNPAFAFHRRGWRGVNIGPAGATFDLLAEGRPDDVNLQADLAPARTLAGLIEGHGIFPPDLLSVGVEGDRESILQGLRLVSWRPKVVVVQDGVPEAGDHGPPAWELHLVDQGYLPAAIEGASRWYLRGDLTDSLDHFHCPASSPDPSEEGAVIEQRKRADSLHLKLVEERRLAEEALTSLNDYKVDLARLKARFGDELEARHRDYLAWLDERERWRAEREALVAEHHALQAKHHGVYHDRLGLLAERQDLLAERQDLLAARQASQAELEALRAGLSEMARNADAIEREREGLAREVDHLHGVIGRLLGDVADREAEIAKATLKLRPYLKLDRLGVVPALQRKVHAHRAHTRD